MSTIQIQRPPTETTRKFGQYDLEVAPSKPAPSDADMMYAWSIGVTSAARDYQESPRHEEECPPEVYIG